MKKLILMMLLFSTFSIMLSCDNESQENSINQTISEKKLVYLGDDIIELKLKEGVDEKVTLSANDTKKVENFKKAYPNSIYFIDKEEVRIFKNDIDLGIFLGKDLTKNEKSIQTSESKVLIKDKIESSNTITILGTLNLYRQKFFVEQLYNNSFYYGIADNCLNNNFSNGISLNDEISSFEINAISNNIDVRFYEHCNYSGKSLYFRVYVGYPEAWGDLSNVQMGSWWWNNWNNEISSYNINKQ